MQDLLNKPVNPAWPLGARREIKLMSEDQILDLKVVTDKLKITQGQLKKARMEAAKLNDETNQKVTALDTSVHSELATKASSDDVKSVDTKVVGVRTDLDSTREDLKMAKSEMG